MVRLNIVTVIFESTQHPKKTSNLSLLLQGILFGLTLAILLGPIFFTVIQLSLQKGSKAGLTSCAGVWVSDFLFIILTYLFIKEIDQFISDSTFTYWMGLVGGFVLIVFGVATFFNNSKLNFEKQKHTKNDYFTFFSKGFLVNTINPFTLIFWLTVISTKVIGEKISNSDATIFFGAIMMVIIVTDFIKVFLAKLIRNRLKVHHFTLISKVAGVGLMIFGLVFLWKSQSL